MQSKALNSNSGVAFSPPSIVKDTLGDSGMLLDTDMTITNSPDASPSQVHNIINKIENKLMMREDSGDMQQQQQQHNDQHHQHTFTFARFKPLHSFSLNTDTNTSSTPFNVVDTVQMPKMEIKQLNRKIPRSFSGNTTVHTIGGSGMANVKNATHTTTNRLQSQHHIQFNPYADENDSNSKFQLSKSICNNSSAGTNQIGDNSANHTVVSQGFNRQRYFGNDRTNFIQNERLQIPHQLQRSNSVINLRKENFHTVNISNNMIIKNANTTYVGGHHPHGHHYLHPNSNIDQDNPVMFRNYDLNDEYWLNFE